jgi:hypothetical protein
MKIQDGLASNVEERFAFIKVIAIFVEKRNSNVLCVNIAGLLLSSFGRNIIPEPMPNKRVEASVNSSASFLGECPPPHPCRYPRIKISIIELAKYIKTYIIYLLL